MNISRFIHRFSQIYNLLWKSSLPFLKINSRLKQGFKQRISSDHLTKADIWIHGASAGEAFLAIEIIKHLDPDYPVKILLTSTTSQGMEILKKGLATQNCFTNSAYAADTKKTACKITWFPFDMPDIMEKAVSKINPCIMVILETELWPGLLMALKKRKINTIIINARLSLKSYNRYLKTSFLWNAIAPEHIFAISEKDKHRFGKIFKSSNIELMPNIKFDAIHHDVHNNRQSDHKTEQSFLLSSHDMFSPSGLSPDDKFPIKYPMSLLVSIHKEEENNAEKIIAYLLHRYPDQIIGLFPRHMHRIKQWETRLTQSGLPWQLRSETHKNPGKGTVILWDIFGELRTIYPLALTAFIGGSLKPLGGHNFMESIIAGVATVTGPFTDDFNWTGEDIFKKKIVKKVNTWKSAAEFMLYNLENPCNRADLIMQAENFIQKNTGGTYIACKKINGFLSG